MVEVFTDAMEEARKRGRLATAALWVQTILDVLCSAIPERLQSLARRVSETSHYKGNESMANPMETVGQDMRYAFRGLTKTPGFTTIAVVTIALGIGATTTIFSVANAVLLRPVPGIDNPEELFTAHRISEDGSTFHAFPWDIFQELSRETEGVVDLAALSSFGGSLTSTGRPEALLGLATSWNYFGVLGVQPALGRLFIPEDDSPTGDPGVVVLSYRTWQTRFGGDSSIVGGSINLNGRSITVIGVAEEGFAGHMAVADVGVWVPLLSRMVFRGENAEEAHESMSLETIGRRHDGVRIEQVGIAMNRVVRTRGLEGFEDRGLEGVDVRKFSNLFAPATGPVQGFMALLFAVSGLILLIASVNVANMLLARATGRSREIALRQALGAGRLRIVRQTLAESVSLFLMGGTAGVAISFWSTGLFEHINLPLDLPLLLDFSPDLRVLGFTTLLALGTGVVFGLAPALRVSRTDLSTALNSETAAAGSSKSRLRGLFVISQVAGTTLLLAGAGLFLRSLSNAGSIAVGFDPTDIGAAQYDLRINNYSAAEGQSFWDGLLRDVAAVPGITAVSAINILPLSLANAQTMIVIPGRDPVPEDGLRLTDIATVSSGYFATMRIPILAGRDFRPSDRGGPRVAIINEEIAAAIWPGENAVGQHLGLGSRDDAADIEIVGVAQTGKYRSLGESPRFMLYVPIDQQFTHSMTVIARREGDADGAADVIRDLALERDPDLPVELSGALEDINGMALIPNRVAATIATLFGGLGTILGAVGLYGVLAYSVSQRTREIGVRMALGAGAREVRGLIVRAGLKLTAIGLTLGLLLAFGLTRFLTAMLYGVSPTDPLTFIGIAVLLVVVALAASYFPARRATRTDPMQALRYE